MSVQVPPRIDAYESGISISDALKWQRLAQLVTSGTNIATTGVLLRNADSAATGNIMRSCPPASERGRPSTTRPARSRPPVSLMPAATTKSAAMVTTAGFEKPVNASDGVDDAGEKERRDAGDQDEIRSGQVRGHHDHHPDDHRDRDPAVASQHRRPD